MESNEKAENPFGVLPRFFVNLGQAYKDKSEKI
jgi:hypothetical protein